MSAREGLRYRFSLDGDRVTDMDDTAGKNLTVHSAAAVRDERLAQARVLLIHEPAGFGFAVDLDADGADGEGSTDRRG